MYRRVAKPVLFAIPPDTVHSATIRLGKAAQKIPIFRRALHDMWAYDNSVLHQTLHDLYFHNPIGLSAGFDKNIELPPLVRSIGFGFMEAGTITNTASSGNARPWFFRLPKSQSIVVHAGLANQGIAKALQRIPSYPTGTFDGFPLNISVAQTNSPDINTTHKAIQDCIAGITLIQKSSQANMLTINISCPNTFHGEPFTNSKTLDELLGAVDALNLSVPVFLKMPSDLAWQDFNKLLQAAARHRVAGVTICNLTKDRSNNAIKDILPNTVKGGLSGKPTYEISNQLIRETYRHYKDRFTIIGVGGVFNAEDAYVKIRSGASVVELITGMIYNGPQVIGQINQGLAEMLRRDGFHSITDAIGIDVD
jgi:dihydroorotate dehydrogenase (fumarate)